ncbi:MAG: glycosyltransferase family 2 protein [Ilumatobacter sp.]|nr:MAG: glycosyltransferase family 2 protein [Ilumatobacter sp.]
MSEVASPEVSVVVLTRGDRTEALDAAVASATGQSGVRTEVLVVWNGCAPVDPDRAGVHADRTPPVRDIALAENLGIPEGRNVGARHASGVYLFFLDDDAEIVDADTFAQLAHRFERESDLGVIGTRIVDEHGHTAQRHVPRWGRASATSSGEVTSFLGGVVAIRRSAFESVGGYAGEFFYSMEETDLAWRLADAGWRIWYDADLQIRHPRTEPSRHPDAATRTARNRVWLVHRTLPLPLAVVYLVNWLVVTILRSPGDLRPTLNGYRAGWRSRIGPRRPIRWSTVVRLTRLGRPPVL